MSEEAGICQAAEVSIPQHVSVYADPVFNQTVDTLMAHERARWVVLFAEQSWALSVFFKLKNRFFKNKKRFFAFFIKLI